jgi:hypothetical protein
MVQNVPTLATPVTLKAVSLSVYCSNTRKESDGKLFL